MNRLFISIALLALLAVGRGAGAAEAVGRITHLDQEDSPSRDVPVPPGTVFHDSLPGSPIVRVTERRE